MIVVYAYVDTWVFLVSVSKSVLSINGLSFVSPRPTSQPCVSVFMVRRIREINMPMHIFNISSVHSRITSFWIGCFILKICRFSCTNTVIHSQWLYWSTNGKKLNTRFYQLKVDTCTSIITAVWVWGTAKCWILVLHWSNLITVYCTSNISTAHVHHSRLSLKALVLFTETQWEKASSKRPETSNTRK